ncbi:hypothetical protein BGP77_12600 [Saccharospirillum sp. MSK14-1]|nr:hypothetical protein BGP77_12600 [Saccharospirillum sp. MSK14-1]
MISKIIGYSIGGTFIIAFFTPIPITLWLIYDRASVILNSSIEPATIVRCYSHRNSGSNSRLSFGPVAITESNTEVKGNFKWSKREWCVSDIGDDVSVLIHNQDKSKNRIFNFSQFWLMPLLFSLITFIAYPLGYVAKKKKLNNQK